MKLIALATSFSLFALLSNAAPAIEPGTTVNSAPLNPAEYKSPSFNYDIPVPFVPAPPGSEVPIGNGTLLARDGTILSIPLHERSLSNPLIRARAPVHRPGVSYFAGFNVGAYKNHVPHPAPCKTLQDWRNELRKIKSFNNAHFQFSVVKIFTTAQCSTLKNALQAAKEVGGIKVWAGIWASDNNVFTADKNAVGNEIRGPNGHLIAGISVGSEEMFRRIDRDNMVHELAGYIWDVKGMVQNAYGKTNVPVGTSDSIVQLMQGRSQPVLDACDVVLVTMYPYFGGVAYGSAGKAFQQDWSNLQRRLGNKPLVLGESGWPSLGNKIGAAVTGTAAGGAFWKGAACWMRANKKSFFWFEAMDEHWKEGGLHEQRFGVTWTLGKDAGRLKYSLGC